ncbi:MAG: FAD-dependent monooxygenase [Burkholderiaceae bacterium]
MHDVAIAGAGPAGSLAALLLARQGLRVALIGAVSGERRLEGASARTLAILNEIGLRGAGVIAIASRHSQWPGLAGALGQEALIARRMLDRGLYRAALAAGVEPVRARVLGADAGAWQSSAGYLSARVLIDARGRRAPAAQGRLRAPLAIAIAGAHRADRLPAFAERSADRLPTLTMGAADGSAALAEQTADRPAAPTEHGADRRIAGLPPAEARAPTALSAWTEVRATPLGWVWRAGWGGHARWTQIVIDAQALSGGAGQVPALWDRFFAQAEAGQAEPLPGRWRARAAAIHCNPCSLLAGDPLRIGDAAVAFDPLSGHGLFWALASARMAVPVVHALLDEQTALADGFVTRRVRDTFLHQARIGRDFHRQAATRFATPFWARRADWPDDEPVRAPLTRPMVAPRVIVRDHRLVNAEVVCTPQEPDGVAFVRGVEMAPLFHRLHGQSADDAMRALAACVPGADIELRRFLLGWLLSRGVVRDPRGVGGPA